jgi:two-component system LytT family response regulator
LKENQSEVLKALIIDDETSVIKTITTLIEQHFTDIGICGSANNINAGYRLILKTSPDILLLDINLPDGNGFDLLRKFKEPAFKLIFITAHEEYAIKAFKFSAIDYLLKPIDESALISAVNRARNLKVMEEQHLKVKALLDNLGGSNATKKIILRTADSLHLINVSDIIRCEADSNYTFFYLKKGKRILVSKTIKEYSELLKPSGFIRVHQSHLVNTDYVDRYVKTGGGTLIMKDDSEVPISHDRRAFVLKQLESFF